jgi:hypothetical protein
LNFLLESTYAFIRSIIFFSMKQGFPKIKK